MQCASALQSHMQHTGSTHSRAVVPRNSSREQTTPSAQYRSYIIRTKSVCLTCMHAYAGKGKTNRRHNDCVQRACMLSATVGSARMIPAYIALHVSPYNCPDEREKLRVLTAAEAAEYLPMALVHIYTAISSAPTSNTDADTGSNSFIFSPK